MRFFSLSFCRLFSAASSDSIRFHSNLLSHDNDLRVSIDNTCTDSLVTALDDEALLINDYMNDMSKSKVGMDMQERKKWSLLKLFDLLLLSNWFVSLFTCFTCIPCHCHVYDIGNFSGHTTNEITPMSLNLFFSLFPLCFIHKGSFWRCESLWDS